MTVQRQRIAESQRTRVDGTVIAGLRDAQTGHLELVMQPAQMAGEERWYNLNQHSYESLRAVTQHKSWCETSHLEFHMYRRSRR